MTEQELAAIEARVTAIRTALSVEVDEAVSERAQDVPALIAEVRRLRALVESAYREGFWDGEGTVEKHVGYGDTAWWMSDARRATKEEA